MEVPEYSLALIANCKQLLLKKIFCDIEIVVDNQLYTGHKIILAAASSQLHKLIQDTENGHEKSKILLSGITSVGFGVLFEFMYSGVLNIDETNIHDVTMAAMVLGVHTALAACTEFQRQKLSVCNLSAVSGSIDDHQEQGAEESDDDEVQATSQNELKQEVFEVSEESSSPQSQWSPQSVHITQSPPSDNNSVSNTTAEKINSVCSTEALDVPGTSEPVITSSYSLGDIMEMTDPVFSNSGIDELANSGASSSKENANYTEERDDGGDIVWRCKLCAKIFRTLSYLKNNHIPLHTGGRYWCRHCNKSFSSKTSLKNHVKLHLAKQGFKPYNCNVCEKSFSSQKACYQHRNTHTFSFSCEQCTRVFATNDERLEHTKKFHT